MMLDIGMMELELDTFELQDLAEVEAKVYMEAKVEVKAEKNYFALDTVTVTLDVLPRNPRMGRWKRRSKRVQCKHIILLPIPPLLILIQLHSICHYCHRGDGDDDNESDDKIPPS